VARFQQQSECQVPILAALPKAFTAPQALAENYPPLAQSWRWKSRDASMSYLRKVYRRLQMNELGKTLLGLGLLLTVTGALLLLAGRIGLPLGRLPGDIAYKGKHVSVFFPLGTCILISVVLSAIFYLFSRFHR